MTDDPSDLPFGGDGPPLHPDVVIRGFLAWLTDCDDIEALVLRMDEDGIYHHLVDQGDLDTLIEDYNAYEEDQAVAAMEQQNERL